MGAASPAMLNSSIFSWMFNQSLKTNGIRFTQLRIPSFERIPKICHQEAHAVSPVVVVFSCFFSLHMGIYGYFFCKEQPARHYGFFMCNLGSRKLQILNPSRSRRSHFFAPSRCSSNEFFPELLGQSWTDIFQGGFIYPTGRKRMILRPWMKGTKILLWVVPEFGIAKLVPISLWFLLVIYRTKFHGILTHLQRVGTPPVYQSIPICISHIGAPLMQANPPSPHSPDWFTMDHWCSHWYSQLAR